MNSRYTRRKLNVLLQKHSECQSIRSFSTQIHTQKSNSVTQKESSFQEQYFEDHSKCYRMRKLSKESEMLRARLIISKEILILKINKINKRLEILDKQIPKTSYIDCKFRLRTCI